MDFFNLTLIFRSYTELIKTKKTNKYKNNGGKGYEK